MIHCFLINRAACILVAVAAMAVLSGCCSGPCPDTKPSSQTAPKEGKDMAATKTSGPHQGN